MTLHVASRLGVQRRHGALLVDAADAVEASDEPGAAVRALTEGLVAGSYRFRAHKADDEHKLASATVVGSAGRLLRPTGAPLSELMTDRSLQRWAGVSELSLERLRSAAHRADGSINDAFVTIALVGIFLAYAIVLATSLLTGSIGAAIAAMVTANIVTQLFLWWLVKRDGIQSVIDGDVAVWNTTALAVLAGQLVITLALLALTYALQARKKEYI